MSADSATAETEAPALSVLIFSKNDCAICVNTENTFTKRGVPYTEINVQEDLEPREEFGGLAPIDHVKQTFGLQMPVVIVRDDTGFAVDSWTGGNMMKLLETVNRFRDAGLLITEDARQAA